MSDFLTTPPPPVPVLPVPSVDASPEVTSLAGRLRASTVEAHQEVERRLRLPDSITSLVGYEQCLLRFYQLYLPLEILLASFTDWHVTGLEVPQPYRSIQLAADLGVLGISVKDHPVALECDLPSLPTIASAIGAVYVLEGSALGSQYILPPLQKLLGQRIAGAEAFFKGRGAMTGSYWNGFRVRVDAYGLAHPDETSSVIAGANATFASIGTWMRP